MNTAKTFTNEPIGFEYHDGGREAAGYKGTADDCVTRALAIVLLKMGKMDDPADAYQKVYDDVSARMKEHYQNLKNPSRKTVPTARDGCYKKVTYDVIESYGGDWTATMQIGSGCQVHLKANELPSGILICNVSKHITTVVDHVIYDQHNPARGGTRCVYGYWKF